MTPLDRRPFLASLALALPALALPALALPATARAAAASPREIVEAVYGKTDANARWDQRLAQAMGRKQPFSKAFAAALRNAEAKGKKSGEPWLDFDPVSNSQDPSIHGLAVAVASEGKDAACVRAEFHCADASNSPRAQVSYDFTRENGDWTLDDMRGLTMGKKGTGWSLRKLADAA